MCAAHAQIQTAAELSVALRLDGATRSDVQRALWEDRTLVRTFGPRGTVHLVPAIELAMWTGALSVVPRSDGLWLLPYFDAYAVGAQPRRLVFPGRAAERALARTQGGTSPFCSSTAV